MTDLILAALAYAMAAWLFVLARAEAHNFPPWANDASSTFFAGWLWALFATLLALSGLQSLGVILWTLHRSGR